MNPQKTNSRGFTAIHPWSALRRRLSSNPGGNLRRDEAAGTEETAAAAAASEAPLIYLPHRLTKKEGRKEGRNRRNKRRRRIFPAAVAIRFAWAPFVPLFHRMAAAAAAAADLALVTANRLTTKRANSEPWQAVFRDRC